MKNFINFFISLCFTGYIKKIPPGTFATFVSILILFPIVYYKLLSFQILIIIFIFFVLISLYLINLYSKQSKTHDNSVIVIDEFLWHFCYKVMLPIGAFFEFELLCKQIQNKCFAKAH